jgi:dolichyl-phosphate beta-glucosyltransferase
MIERLDLSLILPAFNERERISTTIDEAFAYFTRRGIRAEIIVAVDGRDGTREFVGDLASENPNLRIIGHEDRSGKGRSIREAVALARGRIVGYADADNKVPIEEYEKIECQLQMYHVVIGSRSLCASHVERERPWYRRIGSKGFYYFLQAVVGLPGVEDTQCGFKFFHRDIALRLFELQRIDGYMFDVEILMLAQRLGFRVKEVPIRWRDDGDSRLELLSGNFQNVIDIFRIRSYCRKVHPVAAAVPLAGSAD